MEGKVDGRTLDQNLSSFFSPLPSSQPHKIIAHPSNDLSSLSACLLACAPAGLTTLSMAAHTQLDPIVLIFVSPYLSLQRQRKWKQEGETLGLELQGVRSRLAKARKDASRLERALAEATAKAERQARDSESASPLGPSAKPILGDWVAEERPCGNGGESKWALSRKSVNGRPGSKVPSAPRAAVSLASKPGEDAVTFDRYFVR